MYEEEGEEEDAPQSINLIPVGITSRFEQLRKAVKRIFPWIVCATSFIVQFFVLGFYKSFGPVYVKLLKPRPEGLAGSYSATCMFIFIFVYI